MGCVSVHHKQNIWKKNPIHSSIQNKILRNKSNPGSESYKSLMKEIEEDANKWKAIPCLWTNIKMPVLPIAIYRFPEAQGFKSVFLCPWSVDPRTGTLLLTFYDFVFYHVSSWLCFGWFGFLTIPQMCPIHLHPRASTKAVPSSWNTVPPDNCWVPLPLSRCWNVSLSAKPFLTVDKYPPWQIDFLF